MEICTQPADLQRGGHGSGRGYRTYFGAEISEQDITRWRLLRWYDNSAANTNMIVSVVPTEMRQVRFDNGRKRCAYDGNCRNKPGQGWKKEPGSLAKTVTLTFLRKGQRLFASTESPTKLWGDKSLTGKMLD